MLYEDVLKNPKDYDFVVPVVGRPLERRPQHHPPKWLFLGNFAEVFGAHFFKSKDYGAAKVFK